jgi:uncharacterized membrane protein
MFAMNMREGSDNLVPEQRAGGDAPGAGGPGAGGPGAGGEGVGGPDAGGPDIGGPTPDVMKRLAHFEQFLAQTGHRLAHIPSWRRPTPGEHRWPVAIAVMVAIGLQFLIPSRLALHPVVLLPSIEFALLVLLIVANPRRIEHGRRWVRASSLALVAVASVANAFSAVQLIRGLVDRSEGDAGAGQLLLVGGGIWLTNVIIFALWYWEFDRGGPVERTKGTRYPDFQFPQMQTPDLAHQDWSPAFVDYLYLSFTNAMAFSPTDTLPLNRWAKLLMLSQSLVSLATVALVIARAVNILQ